VADGRLALQKSIYSALTSNATLMGKVTGVFDFIPDNQAYPFVQIGEIDFNPFDTHTENGFSGTLQINVWDRPGSRGRAPIHDLNNDIYDTLHLAEPVIAGFSTLSFRFDFSQILVDQDAVTYHGINRFSFILGGT